MHINLSYIIIHLPRRVCEFSCKQCYVIIIRTTWFYRIFFKSNIYYIYRIFSGFRISNPSFSVKNTECAPGFAIAALLSRKTDCLELKVVQAHDVSLGFRFDCNKRNFTNQSHSWTVSSRSSIQEFKSCYGNLCTWSKHLSCPEPSESSPHLIFWNMSFGLEAFFIQTFSFCDATVPVIRSFNPLECEVRFQPPTVNYATCLLFRQRFCLLWNT